MAYADQKATNWLRAHGFNARGEKIKPKKPSPKAKVFIRMISVPMGGMTRRSW